MQHQRHIQLYEHESIRVGEARNGCTFTESDCNQLLQLNERQYPPYLQPVHRGIRTLNFVGMIQLPGLCLEILPKTDRDDDTKNRGLLLEILTRCQKIPSIRQSISLSSAAGSLSDHFICQFLEEVEKLCRTGLVKKYHKEAANFSRFRGRMLIREQIRQNHAHKEKVFAEYHAFDQVHPLHDFIGTALGQVPRINPEPKISERAKQLLSYFPEANKNNLHDKLGQNWRLNQQDRHYQAALQWAELILHHLAPAMRKGTLLCKTFLFDMQKLFEDIIALDISGVARMHGHDLLLQPSQDFWRQRKIRPDMVLNTKYGETIILDTKWKMLKNGLPDERDLKQMYIYNRFFSARRGVLIYPAQSGLNAFSEQFLHHTEKMSCKVIFAPLSDGSGKRLNPELGHDLLRQILQENQSALI